MRHFFLILISLFATHILYASGIAAHNDSVTVHENAEITIEINFLVSGAQGALTITIAPPPMDGAATVNGNAVLYKPQQGFFGVDSFKYQVCDTTQACATAEIYVTVEGTNLPPVIGTDSYTFADTVTSAVLDVLANDSDPGNDTLYVAAVLNVDSNMGSLSLDSATHNVIFSHAVYTCGSTVFDYVVCNLSRCDTGTITINIACPDSIFFPQGFSPNGDGKNDLLVFRGLEYFSPATINIFNRYGTSVYQSTDYLNDWDGTDLDSHHPLPDGTYFYVLTLPSGKTYNNYVIINR
jgi:gliding motility-associated-like protein